MKRFIFLASAVLALIASISACDEEELISFNQLPSKAQQFILTNFPDATCISILEDHKDYIVNLSDGTCIEFDRNGNWEDIQNMRGVDSKFLPQKAIVYLETTYPDVLIIEISHDPKDVEAYEVLLINRIELKFSEDGTFLGTDF